MKKLKIGNVYRFTDNFKREPLVTGKLLEIDGSEARVELTDRCHFGNGGTNPGEILRVYLPLAVAEAL
jgi:hypothetical protein